MRRGRTVRRGVLSVHARAHRQLTHARTRARAVGSLAAAGYCLADPLGFIATELESHSISGMHNVQGGAPRAGGQVDMFGFTNGVVRDALLKSIRAVAVKRPREPLKAIAEELRSQPAWSAAAWSSQPAKPPAAAAGRARAQTLATSSAQVPVASRASSVASAAPAPTPEITSSAQLRAARLERAGSSDDRPQPTSSAASMASTLRTASLSRGRAETVASPIVDRGRLMPEQLAPPPSPTTSRGSAAPLPAAVAPIPAPIRGATSTAEQVRTRAHTVATTSSASSSSTTSSRLEELQASSRRGANAPGGSATRVSILAGKSGRIPGRPRGSSLLR
jgi:hypothetical protein